MHHTCIGWICYTAAAKCEMRSSLAIIELSYRIVIAIFLIYRIVYRSKTIFDVLQQH